MAHENESGYGQSSNGNHMRTTSNSLSRAESGHQYAHVLMQTPEMRLRTVSDSFLRDPSRIFAVPAFVQLDAPFAVRCSINTEHAEIADMYSELLDGHTPGCYVNKVSMV